MNPIGSFGLPSGAYTTYGAPQKKAVADVQNPLLAVNPATSGPSVGGMGIMDTWKSVFDQLKLMKPTSAGTPATVSSPSKTESNVDFGSNKSITAEMKQLAGKDKEWLKVLNAGAEGGPKSEEAKTLSKQMHEQIDKLKDEGKAKDASKLETRLKKFELLNRLRDLNANAPVHLQGQSAKESAWIAQSEKQGAPQRAKFSEERDKLIKAYEAI